MTLYIILVFWITALVLAQRNGLLDGLHRWIERKFNVIFGFQQAPHADDFRFIIRLGFGPNRRWVNFEAGVNGHYFYASREEVG